MDKGFVVLLKAN